MTQSYHVFSIHTMLLFPTHLHTQMHTVGSYTEHIIP